MKKASSGASHQAARQVRFGVYLDIETRKALLKVAIDEGTPATQIVERLIKDYLRARRKGV